ncbi:MAG: DUF2892 domain-containing protein [Caldilineaceae bacterium]
MNTTQSFRHSLLDPDPSASQPTNSWYNVGVIDRLLRMGLAILLIEVGYFWLPGLWPYLFYGLGALLLMTAVVGSCPLYQLAHIRTQRAQAKPLGKVGMTLAVVGLLLLIVGGSYASSFFSKKFFLEDYTTMNAAYKQALFFSGQEKREEAIANFAQWEEEYQTFAAKYSAYHPYALKGDKQFNIDLVQIATIMAAAKSDIYSGDLHQAHLTLEEVRPIFQEIFKRNTFSMLAIALVDFHDAMEVMLAAADAKDAQLVIEVYPQVDEKLQAVESVANDAEIQAIRQNLDTLLSLAQAGQREELSTQAATLKSSFVKVYLARG